MSDNMCYVCKQDHAHQKIDYPEGARIIVEGDFYGRINLNECNSTVHDHHNAPRVLITEGSFGEVVGHCNDGRALFVFEDERPDQISHSFHFPEGYLRVY